MRTAFALGLLLSLSATPYRYPRAFAPVADLNANTTPAGTLRHGVLTLALEAKLAMWYPEGASKPGREVAAFSEASKPTVVPGPLIRVPAGTAVHLSIRNSLDHDTITFHIPASVRGGTSADDADSVVLAPGARGEVTFTAAVPGNYFYRARTNSVLDRRLEIGGAMAGGIVVDSIGARLRDRVLVLLASTNSAAPSGVPDGDSIIFSINGRSWPNTERVTATVGDTLHWRVINATNDFHPMHLHGFYYRVDAYTYQGSPRFAPPLPSNLMVVTQRLVPFSAMSLTWSPERPGNWLFHCHFQVHVARPNETVAEEPAHANHALTGMQGLVMGIIVAPRQGARANAATPPNTPARQLRLEAVQDSAFPDSAPSMRFLLKEPARSDLATSAGPGFSPPIVIERGKPVAITVVNHLEEPTAVHWHGMELDSYNDGAPGFSGMGTRVSPMIAPRDSFVARFTPPRSGTFIYHSHSNEPIQHRAGMLGALIVVDSLGPTPYDDYTFFLKSARSGANSVPVLDISGQSNPDTVVLHTGRPARLRFISLALLNPNANVILTARPDSLRAVLRDSLTVNWLPIAKDGADLPLSMRTPRLARQVIGMGETYDFEYTPTAPGILRMEVRGAGAGGLLGRVPIKVEGHN